MGTVDLNDDVDSSSSTKCGRLILLDKSFSWQKWRTVLNFDAVSRFYVGTVSCTVHMQVTQ